MTTQTKYRKYDSESDYYDMGYRMYSAEFGRFLAVDPLFEAMPRHNPYHYSYNSPMFWSDPSVLVPVKEKVKNSEKLQQMEFDWKTIRDFKIRQDEEIERFSAFEQYMDRVQQYADWYLNMLHGANFGETSFGAASSGSAGSGVNGSPISLSGNSQIKFTGYTNSEIAQLEMIINSSDVMKIEWNKILNYLSKNNTVNLNIGKITGGTSEVYESGASIHFDIAWGEISSRDLGNDGHLAVVIQHIGHETAHISGYFSGERFSSKFVVKLPADVTKLKAEEVRAQQFANQVLQNFLLSKGHDLSKILPNTYNYKVNSIEYNLQGIELPGSFDFINQPGKNKLYKSFFNKYFKGK